MHRVGIETDITIAGMNNASVHRMGSLSMLAPTASTAACSANQDVYALVAARTGLPRWSGSYTSGYGGEFKVCVERSSGMAFGVYSEYGFATGKVTGRLFEGTRQIHVCTAVHATMAQRMSHLPPRIVGVGLPRHLGRASQLFGHCALHRPVHDHVE